MKAQILVDFQISISVPLKSSIYRVVFLFCLKLKKVTGGVFITQSNIYNSQGLKAVNYFRKKAPSKMLDCVLSTPLSQFYL